jgi:predicted ester cyclase
MSTETNKKIVHRIFEEGINQNKPGVFDEVIAATYVNHDFPVPAHGAEGFKMVIGMFKAGFPDLNVILENTLAEGERVASQGYFSGTHQGEFNGIPATGKSVKVKYIDLWRIENGKAVENWVQMDMIGLMQQLGVMPAPTQP